jgi:transcriptional regulator with XRE-family HTH domain
MNYKELKLRRRRMKLTQNDLAAAIGCSQSRISLFETGSLKPTDDELVLIKMSLKLDEL